jgi:iron(III) transport system permease protein
MEMRNATQLMFLMTGVLLAYLVLPPFFFILHTSLVVDRGLQSGSYTIQHFANIIESLGDVRELLTNSMIFSVGSAGVALIYGTTLAWLAERSNAPFRTLAYVSAYISLG